MAGWFCSSCETAVDKSADPPCACTTGPSPWWWVPTTVVERWLCYLGLCKNHLDCWLCSPFR